MSVKHSVATYNMSFAGDLGMDPRRDGVFESEGAFHLMNETGNPRAFWLNALELVKHFWLNEPHASVMGLQEINLGKGSVDIESSLVAIHPHLAIITKEVVVNPNVKPAVTLIWNTEKLGKQSGEPFVGDLDYVPGDEATNIRANGAKISGKQSGRPVIMIYTTGGYVLINCHGPNHPELSKKTMKDLRNALNENFIRFTSGKAVNKDKVFVMGDFNDRYDAIQTIKLGGHDMSYNGTAPKSCCHNWDSSCTAPRFKSLGIVGRQEVGTCDVPKDADGKPYALAGPGKRHLLGEEGKVENYRYTGDKVFGGNPTEDVVMYRPAEFTGVPMSDHEMVVGGFETPALGGRRKTLRKRNRSNRNNHSRRSHRR
jgi:hypothetical protein